MTDGWEQITPSDATATLAEAAGRLRLVRQAHERFLALWAVDHLLADPDAADRLSADVDATSDNDPFAEAGLSRLFRLGRLDD